MDERELLKRNLELTEENNRLLRKMRRGAIWGGIFKIVWLAILIGVPVYVYITFLQPILGDVLDTIETVQSAGEQVQGLGDGLGNQIRGMFEQFKGNGGVDFPTL